VKLRRPRPRAKTIRPAERYLTLGAEEARRFGHSYVGTEHVLLALLRDPAGETARALARLRVDPARVERTVATCGLEWPGSAARIDRAALATLGIDFDVVRTRVEQTFGPGALERTRAGCLGIAPRLKLALAHAIDLADSEPLDDAHVLLGMLSVPASVAARLLADAGVSFDAAKQALAR
jgi:ATP-dependent Clp protease ATP-binding subunit ClpA